MCDCLEKICFNLFNIIEEYSEDATSATLEGVNIAANQRQIPPSRYVRVLRRDAEFNVIFTSHFPIPKPLSTLKPKRQRRIWSESQSNFRNIPGPIISSASIRNSVPLELPFRLRRIQCFIDSELLKSNPSLHPFPIVQLGHRILTIDCGRGSI